MEPAFQKARQWQLEEEEEEAKTEPSVIGKHHTTCPYGPADVSAAMWSTRASWLGMNRWSQPSRRKDAGGEVAASRERVKGEVRPHREQWLRQRFARLRRNQDRDATIRLLLG